MKVGRTLELMTPITQKFEFFSSYSSFIVIAGMWIRTTGCEGRHGSICYCFWQFRSIPNNMFFSSECFRLRDGRTLDRSLKIFGSKPISAVLHYISWSFSRTTESILLIKHQKTFTKLRMTALLLKCCLQ